MIGQAARLIELNSLRNNAEEFINKTIVFSSGKGGTGKTFVSLSIAYRLSLLSKKVLYVDADFHLPNSHLVLNLVPAKNLNDFFSGRESFGNLVFPFSANLHFVFGGNEYEELPAVKASAESLMNALKKIKDNYDFIIIDSCSGSSPETVLMLMRCSVVTLIANPEPSAVMDAYIMLKILNARRYGGRKIILLNKIMNEEQDNMTRENLTAAAVHFLNEKPEILGTINFDAEIPSVISGGNIFSHNLKPEDQFSKAAARLNDIIQLANIHQTAGLNPFSKP